MKERITKNQLDSESTTRATAVTYLRVSTLDQARRGGLAEGLSIPAQRQVVLACLP